MRVFYRTVQDLRVDSENLLPLAEAHHPVPRLVHLHRPCTVIQRAPTLIITAAPTGIADLTGLTMTDRKIRITRNDVGFKSDLLNSYSKNKTFSSVLTRENVIGMNLP